MGKFRRTLLDVICRSSIGCNLVLFARRTITDIKTISRFTTNWKDRERAWPNNLNIEPTNICNANCIFCAYQYQYKWRDKKGFISDKIFFHAVNTHFENGGKFISLTSLAGENLLDPNLAYKLKYITDRGMSAGIYTNGVLLNKIDLNSLLSSGVHTITISTAPFKQEYFEAIYRNKDYKELLLGIKKLLIERNKNNYNVRIHISFKSHLSFSQTINQPDFVNEILPLLKPEEVKRIIVVNSFVNWCGQINQNDLIGNMRVKKSPLIKRRPCKWTFVPYVCWDGKVRACACQYCDIPESEDELFLGNTDEMNLKEIWLGAKPKELRQKFASGNIPVVCRDCSDYDPC